MALHTILPWRGSEAQHRPRRGRISFRISLSCRNLRVGALNVALDKILKLFGDSIALERHGLRTVFVHGCNGMFAGSRKTDADIRVLALAGTVDHAAHHGHRHVGDSLTLLAPFRHPM